MNESEQQKRLNDVNNTKAIQSLANIAANSGTSYAPLGKLVQAGDKLTNGGLTKKWGQAVTAYNKIHGLKGKMSQKAINRLASGNETISRIGKATNKKRGITSLLGGRDKSRSNVPNTQEDGSKLGNMNGLGLGNSLNQGSTLGQGRRETEEMFSDDGGSSAKLSISFKRKLLIFGISGCAISLFLIVLVLAAYYDNKAVKLGISVAAPFSEYKEIADIIGDDFVDDETKADLEDNVGFSGVITSNTYALPRVSRDNFANISDLKEFFGEQINYNSKNVLKYYTKLYDIYNRYKLKLDGCRLDLALIISTIMLQSEDDSVIFKSNTVDSYSRDNLDDKSITMELDYDYDWSSKYKLSRNNSAHDIEVLAQHSVSKQVTETCVDAGGNVKSKNILRDSEIGQRKLTCNEGETYKTTSPKYASDDEKYREFLKEFLEKKYYISGESSLESYNYNIDNPGSSNPSSGPSVSPTGKAAIDKMTEIALQQEKEIHYGGQKYWSWFGFSGRVEWCASFVSWLFNQVGGLNKYVVKSAAAGDLVRGSVAAGYGAWYEDECTDPSTTPAPGDVIVFDPWVGGTYIPYPKHGNDKFYSSHIGYVYAVDATYVYTIEGNSGDSVKKRQYERKTHCGTIGVQGINGYFRPNY